MAKKQISEGEKIDAENPSKPEVENEIKTFDVVRYLIDTYRIDGDENLKKEFLEKFKGYLLQTINKYNIKDKYNFVFLFDDSTMLKSDADKIYNSVTDFNKKKPVLMILFSGGGVPGSAYLIGKLCREYSNGIFNIAVPRRAKSAATLLCCAANEIHMGSLSELGPIDPQINGLPALGLKNSIEHISELVSQNPKSSEMFAKYLQLSIEPIQIGYYERVAESAMQYAENLLSTHSENLPKSPNEIANELVYKYKDHGFVIDKSEAEKILGSKIVKTNTEEYELSNDIYQFLDTLSRFSDLIKNNFYFIGGINSEPSIYKHNNS